MTVAAQSPAVSTPEELGAFRTLVEEGGEVATAGLDGRIRNARTLAFARSPDGLVGVAALKRPAPAYRRSVFAGSGRADAEAEFPLEVGWFSVRPSHRGRGIARALLVALLERAGDTSLFATCRTDNRPMARALERAGFARAGRPWPSTRGDHTLELFVRRGDDHAR